MINEQALNNIKEGVKTLQDSILHTMEETFSRMGEKEKAIFAKTLQDANVEKLAKENVEKALKLNELFHKK